MQEQEGRSGSIHLGLHGHVRQGSCRYRSCESPTAPAGGYYQTLASCLLDSQRENYRKNAERVPHLPNVAALVVADAVEHVQVVVKWRCFL